MVNEPGSLGLALAGLGFGGILGGAGGLALRLGLVLCFLLALAFGLAVAGRGGVLVLGLVAGGARSLALDIGLPAGLRGAVGRYCRVAMKRCAKNGVRGRLKSFQTASSALLCKVVSARWMLCIAMAVPDYSDFVYFRSGCSKW